jgi:glycosyltransferase involved in cell wall biosynthesis
MFGYGRVKDLITKIGPSVIVVQNDPWNFPAYLKRTGDVPVIGFVAVDGKLCNGKALSGVKHAIFWTKFAEQEAQLGGYSGPSSVIPLGVDTAIYKPHNKTAVRDTLNSVLQKRGLPLDSFVVGVVGRNQHRKRLDLTLQYFAEWVHTYDVRDAVLWPHSAPTADDAFNLDQIAQYYNISDRVMRPMMDPVHGMSEQALARVYNIFDVLATTTMGEGFGLPMFEAMACGVPVEAPDWSALGELLKDAAVLIPCSNTAVAPTFSTIGGIADKYAFIAGLDRLYRDRDYRRDIGARGMERALEPRFRWENIGAAFTKTVLQTLHQLEVKCLYEL